MELYLAGGAVRDVLDGGRSWSKDLDFFFDERDLEPVAAELGRVGRIERTPFGSPRWFPDGGGDFSCDLIAVQRFHNGFGRCHDIVDVLRQFDFTANAVAVDLRRGHFYDPVGGVDDIRRRVMRILRFDYRDEPIVPGLDLSRRQVLWLRVVHHVARLGFEIEPETLAWLRENPAQGKRDRYEEVFERLHPRMQEVIERYGLG
jgi:tRNA nucleotidyltransferase/poly(A) polymerase